MGGAPAAVAHYLESPTPNLIIVETTLPRTQMLSELDRLAECCDAGTKVVVIGHTNDVGAVPGAAQARRERIPDRSDRAAAVHREPVQPLQQSRHRSGRQRHRLHRRQGRRRLEHGVPQRGVGDVGDPQDRRGGGRPRPGLRHDRPRFQPGSDPGHRRSAAEPRAPRRGAARSPAHQVLRAAEHLRRAGGARPRLRDLGRRLRHRARHRAPERAVRGRRPAAHAGRPGSSACCCRPTRWS